MKDTLIGLDDLEIRAAAAEVATWQGRQALRLENGLALVPEGQVEDASIEVLIWTDGPAYSGVAFRVADVANYELAYAVPHVSGQWDALQYDPVFRASNTWQLHHGPGYQREAQVPTGRWFRLKVDYCGSRAAVSVEGQPPLVVGRLAHPAAAGRFGVWTFRPAYFCDLRVSPPKRLEIPDVPIPAAAEGAVDSWFVEGYGVVACEPHGVLNLNRHLPLSLDKARLVRRFETFRETEVAFEFGFSDVLMLELDGEAVYAGENTFGGFADRAARGYVELGMASVQRTLPAGRHFLAAELTVTEGFGWGLILAAHGEGLRSVPSDVEGLRSVPSDVEGLRWLPAELG